MTIAWNGNAPLARNAATVLAIGGVLAAGGALSRQIQPQIDAKVGMTQAQQERIEKLASASLFGQFRSSMADFLWMKADRYLHNGVEFRGMTDSEKQTGDADKVSGAGGDRGHHNETTVVPSAQHDWRGGLGSIERQVRPYKDMSNHTVEDPRQALPLFRLMTFSNPHFVPAYIAGASLLGHQPGKIEEGLQFLREGEANNPDSIEIQTELGELITVKQRRYDEALPHLKKAIALTAARDPKTLTEDEEEAYQNAFRWTVLNRREAGDPAAARAAAEAGLRLFPTDVVCQSYLNRRH
jgi:tetratricopeptide (TPR) repeat protein